MAARAQSPADASDFEDMLVFEEHLEPDHPNKEKLAELAAQMRRKDISKKYVWSIFENDIRNIAINVSLWLLPYRLVKRCMRF